MKKPFCHSRHWISIALISAITACGGGGGNTGSGGESGNVVTPPVVPVNPVTQALQTGDASVLSKSDSTTLLQMATAIAKRYQQQQSSAIADIFGDPSMNLTLSHGKQSAEINIASRTLGMPFLTADDGTGMAAISQIGSGRGLAYGADVLDWIANQRQETQHTALFTRAFNWVVTGKAAGPLPATVKYSVAGYDDADVKKMISNQGKTAQSVSCDLTDSKNTCWQDADLMVFGRGVKDDADLAATVRKYLSAGKAVIYMHSSWSDTPGARKVVFGMGMTLEGSPGNYFAAATGYAISVGRTIADNLARSDRMTSLVNTLSLLAQDQPAVVPTADSDFVAPIKQVQSELFDMQAKGTKIFGDGTDDLYRLLVLWADLIRPDIQYTKISRTDTPGTFLRTFASDSWVAFNRANTTAALAGQGDFMPAAAQKLPVSSSAETIEVTMSQASGLTLIGRGAVPGKPVYIEVVNAAGATGLSVQAGYIRTAGDAFGDENWNKGYRRPARPHSIAIPLAASGETVFNTPFGGPLYLRYSGATAGQSIILKVRGAAKYAHFDFTRPQNQADTAEALAALSRQDFGWQTAKFPGGEIEQTIDRGVAALTNKTPEQYIMKELRGSLLDSNHIANGFNDMPNSAQVTSYCNQFGWDCTGDMHQAPGTQHFVGWLATCGYLCSGSPIDGGAAISGTGWGHAHELGHNTVPRVMTIAFNGNGCVTECNNNILASIQMMRQYKTLGIDTGTSTDHAGLYAYMVANRATGLKGDAKVLDMQTRLWNMDNGQHPMRAVHFQIAFLFTKYRSGEAKPTMESTLDYFTLLTKSNRLVAKAWDPAAKNKYGMSRFTDNTISNPDLLYTLSSKIIGKDLRTIFASYGITLSQTALDSVADLNLPVLPEQFYALGQGKANQLATGQWMDISASTPAYPF